VLGPQEPGFLLTDFPRSIDIGKSAWRLKYRAVGQFAKLTHYQIP
jgi:hypothetical protein